MIIIVFGNYNINLISNNEKYDIRKYNQKLNMSFTVNQGMNYIVLEIDSNNKINQKLKLEAQDKEIQFEAEEIYPYLLLEEKKDLALYINEIIEEQDDTKLEIDDYEKDKNYYIGLNYTENDNKTSLEKYTEDNLKKVNQKTIKRVIAGLIVFFIPLLLDILFKLFGIYDLSTCGIGS